MLQDSAFSFQPMEGRGRASTLLPSTSEQLEGGKLSTQRNWWEPVIVPEDSLGRNTHWPFFEMCGIAIGELCACSLVHFPIRTGHQLWHDSFRRIMPSKIKKTTPNPNQQL